MDDQDYLSSTQRLQSTQYLNPFNSEGLYSSHAVVDHINFNYHLYPLNGGNINEAGSVNEYANYTLKGNAANLYEANYTITNPFTYSYTPSTSPTTSSSSNVSVTANGDDHGVIYPQQQQSSIRSTPLDSVSTVGSVTNFNMSVTNISDITKNQNHTMPTPVDENKPYKRPRRRSNQIDRYYKCSFEGCSKSYGTLNHLNAHVLLQNHGPRKKPCEFKEVKKIAREKRKEQKMLKTIKEFSKQNNLMFISSDCITNNNGPVQEVSPCPEALRHDFQNDVSQSAGIVFGNRMIVPLDAINDANQLSDIQKITNSAPQSFN